MTNATQSPARGVEQRADEIALSVANLCHGSRKLGQAAMRYATIYQAARLGALEALNTSPAQPEDGSGKVEKLREALNDLLSWFPEKPAPAEWRLTAGQYGADDAIQAARAALAIKGGE